MYWAGKFGNGGLCFGAARRLWFDGFRCFLVGSGPAG